MNSIIKFYEKMKLIVKRKKVNLPFGAGKEIAERSGVTVSMVSKVVHFKARSKKVEEEIAKYLGVEREDIFGNSRR